MTVKSCIYNSIKAKVGKNARDNFAVSRKFLSLDPNVL